MEGQSAGRELYSGAGKDSAEGKLELNMIKFYKIDVLPGNLLNKGT